MSRLTEKFFSLSPFKRVLIVILALLLISTLATSYSFYNLVKANQEFFKSDLKMNKKFDLTEKLREVGNQYTSEKDLDALSQWHSLASFSSTLLKVNSDKSSNEQTYYIASHSEKIENEVLGAIEQFDNFEWKTLILFSYYQTDITNLNYPTINFREVRRVSRFLSIYQEYLLEQNNNFDVSRITSVAQKITRISEVITPFLIGKMVSVSIDNFQANSLNKLINNSKLDSSDAKKILQNLTEGYSCATSFYQTLENEFSFFKTARGRAYIAAPLAFFVLDIAFGNPELEYLKILNAVKNNSSESEISKFQQEIKHPLMMIFFPNLRLAKEKFLENQVLKAIICSRLSFLANSNKVFKDPYSNLPLKMMLVDGKTSFYSVGPDLKDDKAEGDDISFRSFKEGLIAREKNRKSKKK